MKHHYLKIHPKYYEEVLSGNKTFEVRINDRDYHINDILHLQEYDYVNNMYSGRELVKVISYILDDENYCKEGYVVLALKNMYICTKVLCPLQKGAADACNRCPDECMYFTKEINYV